MENHAVVITREWHNPEITITVDDRSIGISQTLEDFLKALAAEIGNPAAIFSRSALEKRLIEAATTVTEKMKRETVRVI